MQDLFVDVRLEIPVAEMRGLADPERVILERLREAADRKCDEVGARLRTDRAPEVFVADGHHPLIGDVTLIASRWPVVAPASVLGR